MRLCIAAVAIAVIPTSVLAQYSGGVNIDFNAATGIGSGQPTILFAGAADQGGYWNPINYPLTSTSPVGVRDLGNSFNAVTLTPTWGGSISRGGVTFNNAATSGDYELLMDDGLDLGGPSNGAHQITLGLFAPGVYQVVTYACAPDNSSYRTQIETRSGATVFGTTEVGGVIPATPVAPATHADHTVTLGVAGNITIQATTTVTFGTLNGIQVKRLNPTRLYVRSGAPANGTGLSWASPLGTIRAAINIADSTPSVTEIWVQRGRYYTDEGATPGDRNAHFAVRSNLSINGGFVGTEASLADRGNPRDFANWTIIDGTMRTGDTADDAYDCFKVTGATAAMIEGFLILRGTNSIDTSESATIIRNCFFSAATGSAILSRNNNTTIIDCTFTGCRGNGAAIYALEGNNVRIDRSTFYGNDSGGFCAGVARVEATMTITNSLIYGNTSGCGGNFEVFGLGQLRMYNCTVAGNSSDAGAYNPAINLSSTGNILRNNIIWGNRIAGATNIQAQQILLDTGATADISDNIIEGWDGTLASSVFANNGLDPLFVDPDGPNNIPGDFDDNYRLRPFSPARDSAWYFGIPTEQRDLDVDRLSRPFDDTNVPNTGFNSASWPTDRGAYEMRDASVCPGDLGRAGGLVGPDGFRDNNDFIAFISLFFAADPRADLGRAGGLPGSDGAYDNNDFIAFINAFFQSCP
ncbi:MAG: right-handed parallel beta-helix repeat-containing protein [Phycisphaerales bacterium]